MERQKKDIFETLFKSCYKELFLHALSFVRGEEEAADIVNDVFEYVWEHYQKLDVTVSLKPLLYTMVRSRSIDYLRKEKSKLRFQAYYIQSNPEAEEEYGQYEELIQKLMALIETMPPQTASVFQKCFIEKKKYKEAGDELNITVNTVRTHISKALRILRTGISEEDINILFLIFKKVL